MKYKTVFGSLSIFPFNYFRISYLNIKKVISDLVSYFLCYWYRKYHNLGCPTVLEIDGFLKSTEFG